MKIIGLLAFGFMSFMAPSDGLGQKELNKNTVKSITIEPDINIMAQQAEKYERIGNYKAASLIWEQLAKYAEEPFGCHEFDSRVVAFKALEMRKESRKLFFYVPADRMNAIQLN